MKIICVSDTHGLHPKLTVPPCDVLIHAGDFSPRGTVDDAVSFLLWVEKQPAKHKVFIAGNHDMFVERYPAEWRRMLTAYPGITYLDDSGCEIDGLRFWGSPITPTFFDWAFMRDRGHKIRKHWNLIPKNTDVLITHGPPMGLGDMTPRGEAAGCEDLRLAVDVIEPRLHLFGHIHEGRGEYKVNGKKTRFVNASSINRALHPPVEIAL